MVSSDRGCHSVIKMSFGDGRLNIDFDPRSRAWKVEDKFEEVGQREDSIEEVEAEVLKEVDIKQLNTMQEKQMELTK